MHVCVNGIFPAVSLIYRTYVGNYNIIYPLTFWGGGGLLEDKYYIKIGVKDEKCLLSYLLIIKVQ